MALFDLLIKDVAERFSIGDKARSLLGNLLALMNSQQTGGLLGFLSRFNQAGLNELVSSWVSSGPAQSLSPAQLESALGKDTVQQVAATVGLAQPTASSALAYMIPQVVKQLTPDGYVPNGLPDSVKDYLPGAAGAALGETRRAVPAWLGILPLVVLAGLAAWGYRSCSQAPQSVAQAPGAATAPQTVAVTPTPAPVVTPAPVPMINSRLSLDNSTGKIGFSGVVPDEATRTSILDSLKTAFGMDNINGDLNLNPAAKPAGWLAGLASFLPDLHLPGAQVVFDGDSINVGGAIPEADRMTLVNRLRSIFGPNFQIGALTGAPTFTLEEAIRAANEKAAQAFKQLKSGYSGADLVSTLNLIIINFTTGSAQIPADSKDLIEQAAAALKAAPADARIEIGGHTDNTGDPNANLQLSQARAEAVRDALVKLGVDPAMLQAKGHGGSRPVASNDTEQGRFQNRRIEYSLVK